MSIICHIQEQSKPYDSKKNCWVPDSEEGYIAAEIKETKGEEITVVTTKGNEVNLIKIFLFILFRIWYFQNIGNSIC